MALHGSLLGRSVGIARGCTARRPGAGLQRAAATAVALAPPKANAAALRVAHTLRRSKKDMKDILKPLPIHNIHITHTYILVVYIKNYNIQYTQSLHACPYSKEQYDPLRFEASGQLWGANCTWRHASAPPGCSQCEEVAIDMHRAVCQECLAENSSDRLKRSNKI